MTFAIGRRVIVVDGAERWKEAEVEQHIVPALAAMPPDTTVALFAREEGAHEGARGAARRRQEARAGQVVAQTTVKPWELPNGCARRRRGSGIELDAAAANALVAQVGERQQRLLRELEKLALEAGRGPAPRRSSAEDIESAPRTRPSAAPTRSPTRSSRATRASATRAYLRLREQGERLPGLTYLMASRLREALAIALRLQRGRVRGRGQARAADAPAGRRALHRGCRSQPSPSGCAPRSARSPTWSWTRAEARRCWRADRDALAAWTRRRSSLRAIERDRRPERRAAAQDCEPDCRRACGPRGTSCARRCCGAARRA